MKIDPVLLTGLCVFVGFLIMMFYGLWLQRKAFQTQQRSANTQREAAERGREAAERGRITFELQAENREQVKKSV